jgi:hypothetical protein
MATAPPVPAYKAQRPRVRVTQRLWSEEVALAEATEPVKPKDTTYEFSNGRRFTERQPYEPPDA